MNTRVNIYSESLAPHPVISHLELDEVIFLKTVDSTNLELKRRRKEFRGTNILLLSDEQSKGQGQKGRTWESVAGLGLWMSLHLGRESSLAHNLQLLSIYTGIIVHRAIAPLINTDIMLKWPNDIMINSKKCGGILTELQWQGEVVTSAIIGVGINLEHQTRDFSTPIQELATSLRLEGYDNPDRTALAQSFIDKFFKGLSQLDDGNQLASRWNKYAYKINQAVTWKTGDSTSEGIFSGINEKGDALLYLDENLQAFQTGEIRFNTPS